jgi:1,4-alpha-glucan branching enzyme
MIKTKKAKAKTAAPAVAAKKVARTAAPKASAGSTVKAKPAVAAKSAELVKPAVAAAPAQPVARLTYSHHTAQSVAVAGSFNSWQPEQVTASGDGNWIKELTIAPGRYEYLFVVDGQWVTDPNAREHTPNPFGGLNSVLFIEN